MRYQTILSTADLAAHLDDPDWAVLDCRFSLDRPERGKQDYLRAHIPGALYAHLERDLSGPVKPGATGRHPLPAIEHLAEVLARWGIDRTVQVVAYDDAAAPGAIAARAWWTLRWLGHPAVAVLDGGWNQWLQEGRPVRTGEEQRARRQFTPRPRPELLATTADVARMRVDEGSRVLDARSADRYRGENETIDLVAGHIPGAVSAPYAENVAPTGLFHEPQALRRRYEALLEGVPAQQAVYYCGSGVTAAHGLLGMAHAGLGEARLYVGSWSEWICDPGRPIAGGEASGCA